MATRKYHRKSNKFRKTKKRQRGGGNIPSSTKRNQEEKKKDKYLLDTIETEDANEVRKALKAGADVNAHGEYGVSALSHACLNENIEIVELLLTQDGIDVDMKDEDGFTALMRASVDRFTEIVAKLLEKGADVNATDDYGDTALMKVINCDEEDDRPWYQVEYDIIEIVEKLLKQDGIDVNVKNKNGKTALDIAEETGCTKKIQKLIIKHKTALIIPKGLKRQEDRKNLEKLMSEKDVGNRGDGKMPYELRHKIGEYLGGGKRKTRKTRPKRQRGGGEEEDDELINASYNGHTETVTRLLEKGADMNAIDKYGRTALIMAIQNGHTEIVTRLLEKGANVNAKNSYGVTALHIASREGHTDIVAMLLEKGADVNAKSDGGYTALISASESGHTETVAMLLEKGADVNAKTNWGDTALIQASYYGHTEIVKLLKQYIVAQTLPRHLERQQKRLQVGRVMDSKKMPGDLTHKIITEHFGGKRKTRKSKKSKRKGRKTRRK